MRFFGLGIWPRTLDFVGAAIFDLQRRWNDLIIVGKLRRSDVVIAYRLLLGRDPEDDRAIRWHIAAARGERHRLVSNIISSSEFQSRHRDIVGFPIGRHFDVSESRIEVICNKEVLGQLLSRTTATWHELGETEPHWSVLTDPTFLSKSVGENIDKFYATGRSDVATLRAWLTRNGLTISENARALDFGCGVGRLSFALAPYVREVVGADVSGPHIRVAEGSKGNRANISFKLIDSIEAIGSLPPFDLLFSLIVLQHNPPPVIYALLDALLGRLQHGGLAYFQVPTYIAGYAFDARTYLAAPRATDMEMHAIPQRHLFALFRRHSIDVIEVREDWRAFTPETVSQTFLVRKAPPS